MHYQERIDRRATDDLEPGVVQRDASLAHFEWDVCDSGVCERGRPRAPGRRETGPQAGGVPPRREGFGLHREPTLPKTFESCAIALDDRCDAGSEVVHRMASRSATASRTSAPRAYAGPTHEGHPVSHVQDARCSRARSSSASVERKSRSLKPIPPGVMSKRKIVGRSVWGERTSTASPTSCGAHISKSGESPWRRLPRPASATSMRSFGHPAVARSESDSQNDVVCSSCSGRLICPQPTFSCVYIVSFLYRLVSVDTRTSPCACSTPRCPARPSNPSITRPRPPTPARPQQSTLTSRTSAPPLSP